MTPSVTRIPLLSPAPGTERHIIARRYGEPGARPKAYLQASVHADELPGMRTFGVEPDPEFDFRHRNPFCDVRISAINGERTEPPWRIDRRNGRSRGVDWRRID